MASKKLRFVVLLMVLMVLACTLVACVRPQTTQSYKVIIHQNNGDANVIMWDRTKDFPTLSYSDHIFDGLYLDAEFTTATTKDELKAMWLTEDIDVYVKWATPTYLATIHPQNGGEDVVWKVGDTLPALTNPGYVLDGFYIDADYKDAIKLGELTALTQNIEVWVKWSECDHKAIENWIEDTAPTCTEKGHKHATCPTCLKDVEEDIDALGHKLTHHDAVDSSCTAAGNIEHWSCDTCKLNFSDAEGTKEIDDVTVAIDPNGHSFGAWTNEVPSTCIAEGTKGHKDCTLCGKHFDNDGKEITDLTIAKADHNYSSDWTIDVDATCTTDGSKSHHCTTPDCTAKTDDTVIPAAHAFGDWVDEVPATCAEDGVKGHKDCTVCGNHFDEDGKEITNLTIEAHGHDFEGAKVTYEWQDGNMTCIATRVCKYDATHDQVANANVTSDTTQYSTCEKPELKKYTAVFPEEADWATTQVKENVETNKALGHAWGDVVYTWADDNSTCTAIRTCTRQGCTHSETETVKSESKVTQEYNCVTDELTKYTATFTNTAFETQVKDVVTKEAKTDQHNYTVFVEYVEGHVPTCTEGGKAIYKCSGCDETETRDVEALGHKYTNYTYNNDATCTKDGTETATCANGCGTTDTRTKEGSALGHKYTNYVSNNDATCTKDGTKTATCDHGCGEKDTVTDTGSALGHDFKDYKSNNDAKCGVDGTKTAECNHGCGEKDTVTDVGSALAHKYTNYTYNNDATCTKDGTETATCDNGCKTTDTRDKKDTALGHDFKDYKSNNDAKCGIDGTKTAECDHGCGEKDTVTDVGSALEHKYINYVSNNDATCTEDGTKTATCAHGCGTKDTITDENSKLGHKLTFVVAVDPTCTKEGNVEHYHCDTCGKNFSDAEGTTELKDVTVEKDPSKHSFGAWTNEVAATCVATGTKGHKDCTLCGKHFDNDGNEIEGLTLAIDKDNHDITHYTAQAPTCTDAGWDAYDACTREGCTHTTKVEIPATGHKLGDLIPEVPSTDSAPGMKAHYACTNDGCTQLFDINKNAVEESKLVIEIGKTATYTSTIVIADYAKANDDWTDNSKHTTVGNDVFIATTTEGNNNGKFGSGTQWRIYESDSATVTISPTENYKLASVIVTYIPENQGVLLNGIEQIASGDSVTITGGSITFSVGHSLGTKKGQARITQIAVVYSFKSDAEIAQAKADTAAAALTCDAIQLKKGGTQTLPSTGENGELITWSIAKNDYVTCADNVLTAIDEPTDDNIQLTLTATVSVAVGGKTATAEKTFENKVTVVKGEIQRTVTVTSNNLVKITVTDNAGNPIDPTVEGGAKVVDGTELTIAVNKADGKLGTYTFVVKNNGAPLTANADGTYTVKATADVSIIVEATPDLTTEELRVYAAYDLDSGAKLDGELTLNGTVMGVDNNNVTIKVGSLEKYPIVCYNLTGRDNIAVGDTIMVTGTLMNYYNKNKDTNTIEFASGCTFVYTCDVDVTINVDAATNATVKYFDTKIETTTEFNNVTKGSEFTFHIELESGYQATYSTDGGTTKTTVYEDGDCSVTVYTDTTITIATEAVNENEKRVEVDLTKNFDKGYGASSKDAWSTTYSKHTVTGAALGFGDYVDNVEFSRAAKLASTITTMPVLATNANQEASTAYVTITANASYNIDGITFKLTKWSSDTHTIKIEYTTDGSTWKASTATCSVESSSDTALPDGVVAVRLSANNTITSNKRLGIAGFELVLTAASSGETGGDTGSEGGESSGGEGGSETTMYAVNFETPTNGAQLTVKNGDQAIDAGQTGASVAAGTVLTITASAPEGYDVTGVLVNNSAEGVKDNGDGTYSYTVTAAVTSITVTLEEQQTTGGGDETPTVTYANYSHTMAKGDLTNNADNELANANDTTQSVKWNLVFDTTKSATIQKALDTKGIQIGSANKPAMSIVLKTSDINNFNKIKLNLATGSGATASVSVKVGVDDWVKENTDSASASLTKDSTDYIFVPSDRQIASGEIVITITQTTGKAIYIKSIEVTGSAA